MGPEETIQQLARRQDGLVTRSQALTAGLSDHAVESRLKRGLWQRVQAGVYVIGAREPDWDQRVRAAFLAAAPAAVVSHRTAARMWRLDGVDTVPIEISIPHGRRATPDGVIVHRSRSLKPQDITFLRLVPVTTVERTLVDAARFLGERGTEKALESALRRRLVGPAAVETLLSRLDNRVPGRRVLEDVLRLRGLGRAAGSGAEVDFMRALRKAGVPLPVPQHRIALSNDRVYIVDHAWPDLLVAAEIDGFEFHSGRAAHAADLERQNALIGAGWLLLRYTGTQVSRSADAVAREVGHVLARRAPSMAGGPVAAA